MFSAREAADTQRAIVLLRDAKHRLVVNGRYLRDELELDDYVARLGWRWLDHAEQHLAQRLDTHLRGGA